MVATQTGTEILVIISSLIEKLRTSVCSDRAQAGHDLDPRTQYRTP